MKRIAIIVHELDRFGPHYFLGQVSKHWQSRGYEVRVSSLRTPFVGADLAILHVDMTRVPDDYIELAKKYPHTINARVVDTSKRFLSRILVNRPEEFDGPVIVKSNLNAGGMREAAIAGAGLLPAQLTAAASDYRVYECACDVPRSTWENPYQVVEKFKPERRDGFYCLRTWSFFGDAETNSLSYSEVPVVKLRTVVRREVVPEVPVEIRALRNKLGFDYGKFDYTISDNGPVLFDVNRTPMAGDGPISPALQNLIEVLAGGIDSFLAKSS